jgi:hypothetical protein
MKTRIGAAATLIAALVIGSAAQAGPRDASDFNKALELATQDKTKAAHKIVDRLLSAKTDIPRDRLLMTKGRLLFQDGDVKASLTFYEQVPTDSDHWLEALEERAWAHARMGEHGQALAQLRSLKAPLFEPLVGPEPYFLTGLIHLKICDYPKIFDAIKEFQAKYRGRVVAMQQLARTGNSEAAQKAIAKLRTAPLAWKTIATEASQLPRLFHRDTILIARVNAMKTGGSDASPIFKRLQQLAQRDNKEISDIIQKMHLLEAEVIQRIHMAENPKNRGNRNEDLKKGEEVLVFADTNEFWLDELNNYHVNVKGCPESLTGGQKL